MTRRRLVAVLLVLVTGVGAFVYLSQDTRHDVVTRHAGRLAAVRAELGRLAGVFPRPTYHDFAKCPGLPKGARPFRYDADDLGASNTGLVPYARLHDPFRPAGRWDFIASPLADQVAAAAPGYRPSEADEEWADDAHDRAVSAMARVRYVVVVRPAGVNPGTGDTAYTSLSSSYLGYVAVIAELRTRRILCTIEGTAGIDEDVLYSYRREADAEEQKRRATEAIEDTLRHEARTDLEKRLNGLGRGPFHLDDGLS